MTDLKDLVNTKGLLRLPSEEESPGMRVNKKGDTEGGFLERPFGTPPPEKAVEPSSPEPQSSSTLISWATRNVDKGTNWPFPRLFQFRSGVVLETEQNYEGRKYIRHEFPVMRFNPAPGVVNMIPETMFVSANGLRKQLEKFFLKYKDIDLYAVTCMIVKQGTGRTTTYDFYAYNDQAEAIMSYYNVKEELQRRDETGLMV